MAIARVSWVRESCSGTRSSLYDFLNNSASYNRTPELLKAIDRLWMITTKDYDASLPVSKRYRATPRPKAHTLSG